MAFGWIGSAAASLMVTSWRPRGRGMDSSKGGDQDIALNLWGRRPLTYVKSTSINLMVGIPSYFSGSNPNLSNLRLAARSTCDLN
jgi:hypothetical protein